jgi:N-succinyldiaminopimelate aminotransferase
VPAIPPHGGWSLLLDTCALGLSGEDASRRLLRHGKIAATAMANWGGPETARYLRFVFANEPVERLAGIGQRVRRALGAS